jgi:hypothetical protein
LTRPAIQSEGNVNVASTVPLSAVATDAGAAPVRIFNTALRPDGGLNRVKHRVSNCRYRKLQSHFYYSFTIL